MGFLYQVNFCFWNLGHELWIKKDTQTQKWRYFWNFKINVTGNYAEVHVSTLSVRGVQDVSVESCV